MVELHAVARVAAFGAVFPRNPAVVAVTSSAATIAGPWPAVMVAATPSAIVARPSSPAIVTDQLSAAIGSAMAPLNCFRARALVAQSLERP